MVTGEIKNKIDQIWDTFFVAGITNPITVVEQMTYLLFMKLLDDKQLREEENASAWGTEVENPTFPEAKSGSIPNLKPTKAKTNPSNNLPRILAFHTKN